MRMKTATTWLVMSIMACNAFTFQSPNLFEIPHHEKQIKMSFSLPLLSRMSLSASSKDSSTENPIFLPHSSEDSQDPNCCFFWFHLVDNEGNPFQGTRAGILSFNANGFVSQFSHALIEKYGTTSILHDITPSQLQVFTSRTVFENRNEGSNEPSEEDLAINEFGKTMKSALIVLVPLQEKRKQDLDFLHKSLIHYDKLSENLKALARVEEKDGCLEIANGFPYPPDMSGSILFIRQCYLDVFDLLASMIPNKRKLAVSGTPGIGKSSFFIYLLWRFLQPDESWQPKKIIYHHKSNLFYIDIEKQEFVKELETCDLYIIDGHSKPITATVPTIYIAPPYADSYRKYLKKGKAVEFCFPIWTMDELKKCRAKVYPTISQQAVEARYDIYGGIARIIFDENSSDPNMPVDMSMMDEALNDIEAVRGIRRVTRTNSIYEESHILVHCVPGEARGLRYQFLHSVIGSSYIGKELWKRCHYDMAIKLEGFLSLPENEISRHLFESYMHLVLQDSNVSLRCRNLSTGKDEPNFVLKSMLKGPRSLKENELPIEFEEGVYYEGCDNFPSMNAVIPGVGIMQATIAEKHPIMGVQTLQKVCKILNKKRVQPTSNSSVSSTSPIKYYFVVPPPHFHQFKLQPIQTSRGKTSKPVPEIEQYVLELNFKKWQPSSFARYFKFFNTLF